ncbi:putative cytochrome P450 [Fusarium tricinctum]|uniref:Cytochrome P450 n=1 Tax=Fusarium tricinctum TaxID=61284 RepID=A0A8K0WEB3_9HYPO|nr:putative cytochrome P450 [Fusarium tricinctum]
MLFLQGDKNNFTLVIAGLVAIVSLAVWSFTRHDSREPPLAPVSIPYLSHIIGLSRETYNYYVNLSKKISSPIFTVSLPGQKMYVVTNADLVQKVQKQYDTIAFPPLAAAFSSRTAGTSEASSQAMKRDNYALVHVSNDILTDTLKPGENLDRMNRVMLGEIGRSIQALEPAHQKTVRIQLNKWLRETLTRATTRSMYGPKNPYEREGVYDAFWDFEGGLVALAIGILPSIVAKTAVAGREKVAAAIRNYYKEGGLEASSEIPRRRYDIAVSHKIPESEIARFETGMALAIILNTGPATFWMVLMAYLAPGLKEDLRGEIDACTKTAVEKGVITKSLDILNLKESCPLLLSTYQEVLRYFHVGTLVRQVTEDTYLDQYLLKKGAMVHMPSRTIHHDPNVYGPNASDFVPRRFLPSEKKNRPKDHCFRGFGGGKHLCPGRHFATNEVLATAAVFIARFDMDPVRGKWEMPTGFNSGSAGQIMEPDHDVEVDLRTRDGFEDVVWELRLKTSDKIFAIVTEDMDEN